MEGVVADARRIEKILQEQPASGVDSLMESMNRQIQILKKDLLKAHEKLAAQPTAAPQTAALAAPLSHAVAAAQPPLASLAPPQRTQAAAPQPQPMATAQAPQYFQEYQPHFYRNEDPQYFRGPRRQDRRSVRCFLCDEEGAFCLPLSCPHAVAALVKATDARTSQTAAFRPSIGASSSRW